MEIWAPLKLLRMFRISIRVSKGIWVVSKPLLTVNDAMDET